MPDAMEAISASKEIYYPSAEVIANSNVPDYLEVRKKAIEDPVSYDDQRLDRSEPRS